MYFSFGNILFKFELKWDPMKKENKDKLDKWYNLTMDLFANNNLDLPEVKKDLVDKVSREHRTNQQLIFKNLVIELIKHHGSMDSFDLRNESTVKFCKDVKPILADYVFPYI